MRLVITGRGGESGEEGVRTSGEGGVLLIKDLPLPLLIAYLSLSLFACIFVVWPFFSVFSGVTSLKLIVLLL